MPAVKIKLKGNLEPMRSFFEALKTLFSAIDTPGGHIFICMSLLVWGLIFHHVGMEKQSDACITGALAVLFMAMKGQNGGRVTVGPPEGKNLVNTRVEETITRTSAPPPPETPSAPAVE
jgi:hypothetical protein